MRTKSIAAAVAATLTGIGALLAAAPASAVQVAPTPGVVTTAGGESGYYLHSPGIRMGGAHMQVVLSQPASAVLGTSAADGSTVSGAVGAQLCDPATGSAVQLGAIYVGNGEWEFAYAAGTLNGDPSNGDPCVGGLLTTSGTPAVVAAWGSKTPITEPTGARVRIAIQTWISPHATAAGPGRVVTFSVTDMTTGLIDWTSQPVALATTPDGNWPQFHEAAFGVQQIAAGQALTALAPVTEITYAQAADYAGQTRWLDGPWPATEVVTTTDGTPTGSVLVSPQGSLAGGHFTVFSASPVTTP